MALSNAERQKAYRERNGITVTMPRNVTDRNGWDWDEHHIFQKCQHGRRYCQSCGTTITPHSYTSDQWTHAHRVILAGIERTKKNGSAAATGH